MLVWHFHKAGGLARDRVKNNSELVKTSVAEAEIS